jgi:galactarate dehydratase
MQITLGKIFLLCRRAWRDESVEAVGERIFRAMLATASGAPTLSEQQNYGNNEFVPWQVGAVM